MSRKPDPPEGKPDVTVGALPLITREAPKANGRSLLDNPKVSAIVLGLVVLAGIVPRTHHLGRSLWTAEAWLANSTLEDTLPHMFHYQNWLQTTPPLLLLLVRGTVKLFGLSEYSLRAVPFILGILALILVAALSFRAFRPPFAVVCTGLVAISPTAIYYSQVLKQYSGDMAAASLILLVLWRYGERGTTRRYVQVLLALTACLLFSYTSVMFIPLIIAFIVFVPQNRLVSKMEVSSRIKSMSLRIGALLLTTLPLCALNYFYFIKPNVAPHLMEFWKDGFPPAIRLTNLAFFYCKNFIGLAICFFVPTGSLEALEKLLTTSGPVLWLLILGIASTMIGLLGAAALRISRYRCLLLFVLIPISSLAAINLAQLYPVSRRLASFLLPSVALGMTLFLEAIWEFLIRPHTSPSAARRFLLFSTVVCSLGSVAAIAKTDQWVELEQEDMSGTMRYLKSRVMPDDSVYIHASLSELARLYVRVLRWQNPPLIYGDTGWPCCARNDPLRGTHPSDAYIEEQFQSAILHRGPGALWLAFTARTGHWLYLGRDESVILLSRLNLLGYVPVTQNRFTNVVLYKFATFPIKKHTNSPQHIVSKNSQTISSIATPRLRLFPHSTAPATHPLSPPRQLIPHLSPKGDLVPDQL